jgi:hypothetical protein
MAKKSGSDLMPILGVVAAIAALVYFSKKGAGGAQVIATQAAAGTQPAPGTTAAWGNPPMQPIGVTAATGLPAPQFQTGYTG